MRRVRINLNITDNCNFQCKTCLREYERGHNLDIGLLKKILLDLKRLGFNYAALTGGEPILHPEFSEIVSSLVAEGFNYSFVSNGFYWDQYWPIVEKTRQNLTFVRFSMDGPTKEIHDQIRMDGSFEKVIEAIRDAKGKGLVVYFVHCLNRMNKDYIYETILLSRRLDVPIFFTSAIETSLNGELVLSDEEKDSSVREISRIKDEHRGWPITITASLRAGNSISFCTNLEPDFLTINPNAEVAFCCGTIRKGAVIGDLKTESIFRIYEKALDVSRDIKRERLRMIRQNKIPEGFRNCEFCNKFLAEYIK